MPRWLKSLLFQRVSWWAIGAMVGVLFGSLLAPRSRPPATPLTFAFSILAGAVIGGWLGAMLDDLGLGKRSDRG